MMLAGILFWLSPRRRRFMRQLANPVVAHFRRKTRQFGSQEALRFISTLLDANSEFLASALSPEGLFATAQPTQDSVAACLRSTLLYCSSLYAREELARDHSDLL